MNRIWQLCWVVMSEVRLQKTDTVLLAASCALSGSQLPCWKLPCAQVAKNWGGPPGNSQGENKALHSTASRDLNPADVHVSDLRAEPPPVGTWEDYSPTWHLDCKLVGHPVPEDSWMVPRFLTCAKFESAHTCFKPLYFLDASYKNTPVSHRDSLYLLPCEV